MKVRHKKTKEIGISNTFNTHSLSEIFVYLHDGVDSDFMRNYDVFIEAKQEWKDLRQAFKDHDVITDNYIVCFFEPCENERGERV